MIESYSGNILTSEAEALVNTVNTVGVMGKGIAYQFKKAWPAMEKEYTAACARKEVQIGKMHIWDSGSFIGPRYIINFPTKRHWRQPSLLSYVQLGLKDLVHVIRELGIRSIAIPPLGCGNGGLDWNIVKKEIETAFQDLPEVQVFLYEPAKTSQFAENAIDRTSKPGLTAASANILRIIYNYYILEYFNPRLIEIHKLLYFYEYAGEPLKLNCQKFTYGPYSKNVHHLLRRLNGHYLTGLGTGEALPMAEIRLVDGVMKEVNEFLDQDQERFSASKERADRVLRLIEGFENPYGMELLATVHWVVCREGADSIEKTIELIQKWNSRKAKIFPPHHIRIAWERLQKENFLNMNPRDSR